MNWSDVGVPLVAAVLGFVSGGGVAFLTRRGRLRSVLAADLALREKMTDPATKASLSAMIDGHARQLASEETPKAFWQRLRLWMSLFAILSSAYLRWAYVNGTGLDPVTLQVARWGSLVIFVAAFGAIVDVGVRVVWRLWDAYLEPLPPATRPAPSPDPEP